MDKKTKISTEFAMYKDNAGTKGVVTDVIHNMIAGYVGTDEKNAGRVLPELEDVSQDSFRYRNAATMVRHETFNMSEKIAGLSTMLMQKLAECEKGGKAELEQFSIALKSITENTEQRLGAVNSNKQKGK